MQALEAAGLDDIAIEAACSGRPFLGVCVGMQMLYEGSEEVPEVPGLGVLPGTVRLLPDRVKRPQIQWNILQRSADSGLLARPARPGVGLLRPLLRGRQPHEGVVATATTAARWWRWSSGGRWRRPSSTPRSPGAVGLALLANFVAACRRAQAA